jgi:nitroreductase
VTALEAVLRRRSHPSVSADAPTHEQLLPLVEAAATVADHGDLKPWRLIELRGDSRLRLGQAFVEASGLEGKDAVKLAEKPLRASLLIAIVVSYQPSFKVHRWEQDAAAAGVAHTLSLLLDEAGWGVYWRSGGLTRSEVVHRMHELGPDEQLLGWLYVGGVLGDKPARAQVNAGQFLSSL